MKMIIAMIKPHKLPDVKQALFAADVFKMTVTNAKGCGQQKGYPETYRGIVEDVTLHNKTRIEIAVNDEFVDATIKAIVAGAKTGNIGDGKIMVLPMEQCIRIRTEESGAAAIG